jgi:hypothetical protein
MYARLRNESGCIQLLNLLHTRLPKIRRFESIANQCIAAGKEQYDHCQ